MAERTSSEIEAWILEGNRKGRSGQSMGEELGLSKSAVCRILKRNGVESKIGRPSRCALNHAAFDVITTESIYWMGFLFGDGCVGDYGQGAPTLQMQLAAADIHHIEKFRTFLGSTHKISTRTVPPDDLVKTPREAASIQVRSEHLVATLRGHGMLGKKRSPERWPRTEALVNSRDFWRGLLDGDGHIRWTTIRGITYPNIMMYGHMPMIERFQGFLVKHGILANITDASTCLFQVRLLGEGAVAMTRLLYEGAEHFLDRKMETATEILKQHSR